jgi:GNAT superfamily N-acetyltransferase
MDTIVEGPFADLALARRLERAEALGNVAFVETRARLFPDSSARWIEVAGAHALYDGAASPLTQTFGLGLHQQPASADMNLIEAFYQQRGAPVCHEVSPLAGPALLALLNERGYQPIEFTSVMFRPIQPGFHLPAPHNDRVRVRLIQADEQELWAQTGAMGWYTEAPELAGQLLELTRITAKKPGALPFLAELDGRAIAAGVLSLCEGVALLGGASTIPAARKQGAQFLLLEARLRWAAEHGCDVAMISAQPPGGASQRNAERHGFRIAYTRIKWRLQHRDERTI